MSSWVAKQAFGSLKGDAGAKFKSLKTGPVQRNCAMCGVAFLALIWIFTLSSLCAPAWILVSSPVEIKIGVKTASVAGTSKSLTDWRTEFSTLGNNTQFTYDFWTSANKAGDSAIALGFFVMLSSLAGVIIYSLMIAAKLPRKSFNWQAGGLACALVTTLMAFLQLVVYTGQRPVFKDISTAEYGASYNLVITSFVFAPLAAGGLICSFKFKVADDPPNSDYEW